jgi:hypothetical protein
MAISPDLLKLVATVLQAAAEESGAPISELHLARLAMVPRIMSAIDAGERDPERLKRAALGQPDGTVQPG